MNKLNIFLIILFLSFATSSPFIELQHKEIQPGETLLATIELESGEFIKQISESDIKFFEGRKEVFFELKIIFYKGTHYLYAYMTREGNFTMKINNILYKQDEQLNSKNIEEQISVLKKPVIKNNISKTEIVSIKPGLIFLEKEPKIKIINLGNASINFTITNLNSSTEKISLKPMEEKEFSLSPSLNLSFFKINAYKEFSIPIIFSEEDIFTPIEEIPLKSPHEIILKNLILGEENFETIQLFNFGDENITNIKISSDIDFIKFGTIENMSARETRNLSIQFSPENAGHFNGVINITYEHLNESNHLEISFSLFVLPEGSTEENFEISQQTCDEIGGNVCTLEEICIGNATFTKGGEYCCLDLCEEIKTEKGGGSKWIIGIIILIILGLGGYYFYRKSKKIKPEKPEEKIKEISEKYN